MSTSLRDPYPFPKYENDSKFAGHKSTKKTDYEVPTHLAQQDDPWNRLCDHQTLSSTRRQWMHYDPQSPVDNLDFVLKTQYNHHGDLFKCSSEIKVQPETMGVEHGRLLKNRVKIVPKEPPPLNHPLRICQSGKKESIHSIKNAIEGHHTQATNRGYSRKPDGGLFTS